MPENTVGFSGPIFSVNARVRPLKQGAVTVNVVGQLTEGGVAGVVGVLVVVTTLLVPVPGPDLDLVTVLLHLVEAGQCTYCKGWT